MKASDIAHEINWLVRTYGDREIIYMGVRRKGDTDILFVEDITSIRVVKNNKKEPMVLCGDTYGEFLNEKLVKLNWLGIFIKRLITKR